MYLGALAILVASGIFIAQKFFFVSILLFAGALLLASLLISTFRLHYHFFMLLALALPFSIEFPVSENLKINMPSEPMLAMALFTLCWDILKKPALLRELFSGESKWAIPLLACFLIAICFSVRKVVSLKFSAVNLGYILVFLLWMKLFFKNRPDFFLKLLILFSLSQLIVLAFSVWQLSGFDWNRATVKGIFRPFYKDHTIFGATVAILSAFWLVSAAKTQSLLRKLPFFTLGLIFSVGVLLSSSRAAFLSLVFFILVWIALQIRIRIKHMVLGLVLAAVFAGVYQNELVQFFNSNTKISHDSSASYVERIESSGNINTDISNRERISRWYAGLKMAEQRPLTGFGPGTFQFEYIPFQNPKLSNRLTVKNYWHIPENSGGTAHSEYVLALSEMGFPGLFALLLLLGRWTWLAFERPGNYPQRKNMIIAFAAISTYLFHGAVNNFLSTDKFAFLFWGFAAWLNASYELSKMDSPDETSGDNRQTTIL